MLQTEFAAGAGQSIVVYVSDDTGNEVDPQVLFKAIATDSARRAQHGVRIVSMSSFPVRPSTSLGQGSGDDTKIAVAVVYAVP